MTCIFLDWEFSTQAEATASFMALRDDLTEIALGYYDGSREFHYIYFDGTEWLKRILSREPFHTTGM